MKCDRCGESLISTEAYHHRGKNLCEDCYIGALQPLKTCDVAAVDAAKKHRQQTGQVGIEGLTDLQQQIYSYIKDHGKATKQELLNHFGFPDWELEKQFAILRHCELLKGKREQGEVYIVLFEE
ncbi:MAG: hypothetical protein ACRDBM_14680 [Sporomusa sp.]